MERNPEKLDDNEVFGGHVYDEDRKIHPLTVNLKRRRSSSSLDSFEEEMDQDEDEDDDSKNDDEEPSEFYWGYQVHDHPSKNSKRSQDRRTKSPVSINLPFKFFGSAMPH